MSKQVLVKEVMKVNPVIVQPFTTVLEAAKIMKDKKVGYMIVAEQQHPIGILSESDIISKVICEGRNAADVSVEDVMSAPIVVIDPYQSLPEAVKIMGHCKVQQLPIMEENKLIGIITQHDIAQICPALTDISSEWAAIGDKEDAALKNQLYSGKCEDCATLSTSLKIVDGRLLCEECRAGLNS